MTSDAKPVPRILVKQDTGTHYFFAPCPRGLSGALAEELGELGAGAIEPAEAGVAFSGAFDLVYIANLHSRIASRILWRVAQFPYKSEDDVYNGAAGIRWNSHFNADRTFKIDTNAHRSPVKSLDFITLRVKDAVADQFRTAAGRRPSVDARDPDVRIHVFLDEKMCTLYVDTSGESLFKRGKRDHVGEAPLKKNLAAGILRLAKWRQESRSDEPVHLRRSADAARRDAAGPRARAARELRRGTQRAIPQHGGHAREEPR